jgi:spermidine/putrescine transport system substrate-binding protein
MKRFKHLLGVLALMLLLITSVSAQERKLNLFIWSEYIDPQIVKDFEAENQCKVTIDLYEDAESMLAKVQGGGDALYDLVVPPDYMVSVMTHLNLLAPLRHQNIPNLTNIDEKFASPPFDRGNKYTAAYQWGTVGLYIRQGAQPVAESWGVIFDPARQRGAFVLIDSVRDMFGAALKYKGYSLNSTDPKQLLEARDLILEAKKRCVSFEGSVAGENKVLSHLAATAIVYSGEGARGMVEDKATRYFIPREGSQIWLDNLAITARAPHRDLAEKFINYILDGKHGARLSNFTRFATPNRAAKPMINAEDLRNPAIYPPPDIMARLEFLQDLGAKAPLYDQLWTEIKAK